MVSTETLYNAPNNKRNYSSVNNHIYDNSMLTRIYHQSNYHGSTISWVPTAKCTQSYQNCDNWIILDLGERTRITGLAMTG